METMSFKGFFFSILALVAILFSQANHFSNFDRGSLEKHFCAIIFKSSRQGQEVA